MQLAGPAEAQVLAIGARKHEHQPGENLRVYLDPAGHPFCLVLAAGAERSVSAPNE
jgi:hypothetical protein